MTNKTDFLANIRTKLQDTVLPGVAVEHPGSFHGYSFDPAATKETMIRQFTTELEKLSGQVHRVTDLEEMVPTILDILKQHDTAHLMAWDDPLPEAPWLTSALTEAGVEIRPSELPDDAAGRKAQLARIDDIRVGLTGAHGGLADTGAVVLISGPGRGRAASLLPPVHIALLRAGQLYPSLPAFLTDHPTATDQGSNLVIIAGPSRTGDIEMTLSLGVHGPGEVHVIITP